MTPSELESRASAILGRKWQTAFARRTGVDARTVRRWKSGERAVPSWVAALLHAWERLAAMGLAVEGEAEG